MKIMVVSDSHGRTDHLRKAYEKVKPVDLFIHLGDVEGDEDEISSFVTCRSEYVCGNCDMMCRAPLDRLIEAGGKKIFLTHGHMYGYGDAARVAEAGRRAGADITLFGHTHLPLIRYDGGMLLLNPGSISKPRQDGHRPVFAILEINEKGQVLPNIVQL